MGNLFSFVLNVSLMQMSSLVFHIRHNSAGIFALYYIITRIFFIKLLELAHAGTLNYIVARQERHTITISFDCLKL